MKLLELTENVIENAREGIQSPNLNQNPANLFLCNNFYHDFVTIYLTLQIPSTPHVSSWQPHLLRD